MAVSLLSAVGAAAADSAIKAHSGAAPVDAVAAAAYSAHPAVGAATSVPDGRARPAPAVPSTVEPAPPTTAASTVPVTHPAAPPTSAPATQEVARAVATALKTRSTTPAAPALSSADTCGAAIGYLSAHSAPGFRFECPGYALGHQAMTCINVAGVCPGAKLIVISVVCPASYMNEAHNSWVLSGLAGGSIDPYGYCH